MQIRKGIKKCYLCGKEEQRANIVWYSEEQFNLCCSHYRKWLKHHKPYQDIHKKVKPCTKAWHNMCVESEKLFKKWFKQEGRHSSHLKEWVSALRFYEKEK